MSYKMTFTSGWIVLDCVIEHGDADGYDPVSGHYTTLGDPYIETIEHNGQDIFDIVNEETKIEILEQYERETVNDYI